MWDPGAVPTGLNRLAGDPPMNLPPASANQPFQYSPSGVTGAFPQGPPAPPSPVPADYPTWALPSDSPLFPRRNSLSEPAGSMSPWGQGNGTPVPPGFNLLGPWPGTSLEWSPDPPQSGFRNVFGPWPGSDLPGGRNVLDPDREWLLRLYLDKYASSGQTWPPG